MHACCGNPNRQQRNSKVKPNGSGLRERDPNLPPPTSALFESTAAAETVNDDNPEAADLPLVPEWPKHEISQDLAKRIVSGVAVRPGTNVAGIFISKMCKISGGEQPRTLTQWVQLLADGSYKHGVVEGALGAQDAVDSECFLARPAPPRMCFTAGAMVTQPHEQQQSIELTMQVFKAEIEAPPGQPGAPPPGMPLRWLSAYPLSARLQRDQVGGADEFLMVLDDGWRKTFEVALVATGRFGATPQERKAPPTRRDVPTALGWPAVLPPGLNELRYIPGRLAPTAFAQATQGPFIPLPASIGIQPLVRPGWAADLSVYVPTDQIVEIKPTTMEAAESPREAEQTGIGKAQSDVQRENVSSARLFTQRTAKQQSKEEAELAVLADKQEQSAQSTLGDESASPPSPPSPPPSKAPWVARIGCTVDRVGAADQRQFSKHSADTTQWPRRLPSVSSNLTGAKKSETVCGIQKEPPQKLLDFLNLLLDEVEASQDIGTALDAMRKINKLLLESGEYSPQLRRIFNDNLRRRQKLEEQIQTCFSKLAAAQTAMDRKTQICSV